MKIIKTCEVQRTLQVFFLYDGLNPLFEQGLTLLVLFYLTCTPFVHTIVSVSYVWDPDKTANNLRKHGVEFADAVGVLEDERALMREDVADYGEERFIAVGMDYLGRILTVVFTYRGEDIRIISARKATKNERLDYESRRE